MVKFATIFASLLSLATFAMACKRPDCCYKDTCPFEVLNDCHAKCCSTTKGRMWRNGYQGDYYFGVACAT